MTASSTWYPGITQACTHWREAENLQQTFEVFQLAFDEDNDAVIGAARSLVEVVCQIIIDEFHTDLTPCRPNSDKPSLDDWLGCAVKALKLGDKREQRFHALIRAHTKLAKALSDLRDKDCPVSHGREAYMSRLSVHHRRTISLTADAIISYLFEAFMETNVNLALTREPYERFTRWNAKIDRNISVEPVYNEEDGEVTLMFRLPEDEQIELKYPASYYLYHLDRSAYIEAKNAVDDIQVEDEMIFHDSVQDEVVPAL